MSFYDLGALAQMVAAFMNFFYTFTHSNQKFPRHTVMATSLTSAVMATSLTSARAKGIMLGL